ncbi:MAG TPA: response regulator transcription factor [Gemmatimonadaceae bacterium]|nr:response regulator transcription factor [Gemmatimonadaceae bacterium]
MRVLIVEDEPDVREFLARVIREAAWAADVVGDATEALSWLATGEFDLVVLDLGLPDLDGFEVCKRMRARGDRTAVLVLTARNDINDRVRALDAGADDYLAKPFAPAELCARLRALARRPALAHAPVMELADLQLDVATRRAMRAGEPIALTAREFALLEYLMRNAHRVVTRTGIMAHVWDDNFDPGGNAVDVLILRVRNKIEREGLPVLLHTMRGVGYILTDAPQLPPPTRWR